MTDSLHAFAGDTAVPEAPHPQPNRLLFSGERRGGDTSVLVAVGGQASRPLPMYLNVRKHSPGGFEWGYAGSGPAQLALALGIEVVGRARAELAYQYVKDALIAPIDSDSWLLNGAQILAVVEAAERRLAMAHQLDRRLAAG
jgi:hypothetical protein